MVIKSQAYINGQYTGENPTRKVNILRANDIGFLCKNDLTHVCSILIGFRDRAI